MTITRSVALIRFLAFSFQSPVSASFIEASAKSKGESSCFACPKENYSGFIVIIVKAYKYPFFRHFVILSSLLLILASDFRLIPIWFLRLRERANRLFSIVEDMSAKPLETRDWQNCLPIPFARSHSL